jgi:glutamyl-tRNA synthetase
MSDTDLVAAAAPWLEKAGLAAADAPYTALALNSVKEKVSLLSEFPAWVGFYFSETFPMEDEVVTKLNGNAQARPLLEALKDGLTGAEDWSEPGITAALTAVAAAKGVKPGALMPILRFSLSGQTKGPDVKVMMGVLGKERVLQRLDRAAASLPA